MKDIYVFSGLGADERVFQRINFAGHNTNFIRYVTPHVHESIEHYALRLVEQIKTEKPVLIGLSFGGMLAVEVAKHIETEKVILIASAKTWKELPFYYRYAGKIGLHRLLPRLIITKSGFLTNWLFQTKTDFERQLLKEILSQSDPAFLRWAIDKIVRWTNLTHPENIFHIHGTSDRILPATFVKCDLHIKRGGHFMTLNESVALNEILRKQL